MAELVVQVTTFIRTEMSQYLVDVSPQNWRQEDPSDFDSPVVPPAGQSLQGFTSYPLKHQNIHWMDWHKIPIYGSRMI